MPQRTDLLVSSLSAWILAAVSCTALPLLRAVPQLQKADPFYVLIGALLIGVLISVPLAFVMRRLCLGSTPENAWMLSPPKGAWGLLTPREGALFGVLAWGLPVGLIFVMDKFLESSNLIAVFPGLLVWAVCGLVLGYVRQRTSARSSGSKAA